MVAFVLILAATLVTYLVRRAIQRRTPADLRGDWWTSFERDFRAYVSQTSNSSRRTQRRGRKHGSAGR